MSNSSSSSSVDSFVVDFDTGAFTSTEFDAHAFVTSVLASSIHGHPLQHLRAELETYSEHLRGQLVELLNNEYAGFIHLSSDLVGTNDSIVKMRNLLQPFKAQMQGMWERIASVQREIESRITEKKQIASRVHVLKILAAASESVQTLSAIVGSFQGGAAAPEAAEESDMMAYYQTALTTTATTTTTTTAATTAAAATAAATNESAEVATLLHNATAVEQGCRTLVTVQKLLEQAAGFTLTESLSMQTSQLTSDLETQLTDTFVQAFQLQDLTAIAQTIRGAYFCDRLGLLESALQSEIVHPVVEQHINTDTLASLLSATNSTDKKSKPVEEVFTGLLTALEPLCAQLHSVRALQPAFPMSFRLHSVWKDVIETLAALGPRLFATGIPDRFHRNYTVCGQFLATFHSTFLAQDLALNTFQQHPITEQFLVKWKTTIYHRLRFQEIARVLETTLTQQQNLHAAFDVKNTHRFTTRRAGEKEEKEVVVYAAATSSVFTMLSRCWSRQVWMPVLTPQFFKLSLQLIARYVVWLEVQVSYVSPANSEQKTGESSAELPAVKQPTLQQLTLVLAETNTVSTTLAAHLTACLATTANTTSSSSSNSSSSTATSVAALVTNSVAPFLKRIEVVRGTLLSVIADQAFAESAVALQAVNRIKSTYLHSKKAIPTVVSVFVPLLLEPLNKSILQESCPLSIADKQQLVQTTVNLITTKYVQLLQELLAAVQKFQSTLQKLQQGKKKSADDGDAGSRAIQRQIELDIAAYCTQVRGLAYLEQGKLVKDLPALEALIQ